jgi:hypothetical protein
MSVVCAAMRALSVATGLQGDQRCRRLGAKPDYLVSRCENIHDVVAQGVMVSAAEDLERPEHNPRRGKARLRTGVPAVLTTVNGRQVVSLVDLSESGAGLVVKDGWRLNGGVLKWMDYEVYGKVVRRSGDNIGLLFEEPINAAWVLETRAWLPKLRRAADPFRGSVTTAELIGDSLPGRTRVPGLSGSKYGVTAGQATALSVRAGAPLLVGALLVGALLVGIAVGYASSLL